MRLSSSPENNQRQFQSKLFLTIAVLGEIVVNCYIIWYLLIGIPSDCEDLAVVTYGQQTCGIEPGAYIIAGTCALLILLGVYYLARGKRYRELLGEK